MWELVTGRLGLDIDDGFIDDDVPRGGCLGRAHNDEDVQNKVRLAFR